jgi:SulP family sulfate permease
VLIVRPDAPLFYANAQPLRDTVSHLARSADPPVHVLILDLDGTDELDITSAEALGKLLADLGAARVRVGLAHVHAVTARMLDRSGITGKPGAVATFPDLGSAVSWARQVSPGDVTAPGERERR